MLYTSKKSDFPIINIYVAIFNRFSIKTLLWYIPLPYLKRSILLFIVIKPKAELCFSFSNIWSIIINLKSQKVKSFFWVTVKGPTLNFNYLSRRFYCKSVLSIYIMTKLTSALLTLFTAFSTTHLWKFCSH